jgi:branched-chain amino acid transport system permease protein
MKVFKALGHIMVLALIAIPLIIKDFALTWFFNLAVIYSLLTLSWLTMRKYSGYTSFAHAIPFGLSAYLSPFVNLGSVIISAPLSASLFLALSKLGRERFIFSSFVISVIFWMAAPYFTIEANGVIYGGEEGFSLKPLPLIQSYILAVSLMLTSYVFLNLVEKTALGLKLRAMTDDEVAAMGLGINVFRLKIVNFAISSFLAAVAGFCYALFFGHVSPEIYSVEVSIFPFIATLFFGLTPFSAIAGSFILTVLTRGTAFLVQYHLLLYAVILILSPKLMRWYHHRS